MADRSLTLKLSFIMPKPYEDRNPQTRVARTQVGTALVDVVAKGNSPVATAAQLMVD
jgi:hypothetical protein